MRLFAPLTSEPVPLLQSIEVATSLQIPSFYLIGLPGPEVAEAKERVRAAIEASELTFPRRKVIVNLSPASIRKRGTGMDLAIALAVLAENAGEKSRAGECVAWGELGLDGAVKPAGQLTRVLYATWERGIPYLFLSENELPQAQATLELLKEGGRLNSQPQPALVGICNLKSAWRKLNLKDPLEGRIPPLSVQTKNPDVTQARDSAHLLRLSPALERTIGVIATGKHHALFLGPKGTGKSHALEWLVALQDDPEASTRIKQQLLAELQLGVFDPSATRRVSAHVHPASLAGSATARAIRPGEFSLAHGGLLIADELPEWHRDSREALREPLERGTVRISRAEGGFELPARFQFAANGNLCPCGGWPPEFPQDAQQPRCRCSVSHRKSYLLRLSGPILDRIDLLVLARATPPTSAPPPVSLPHCPFDALHKRVTYARDRVRSLWGAPPGRLEAPTLQAMLATHADWQTWLDELELKSFRARHKVMRVALTFGAWDQDANPSGMPMQHHFFEASQYRAERMEQWLC